MEESEEMKKLAIVRNFLNVIELKKIKLKNIKLKIKIMT